MKKATSRAPRRAAFAFVFVTVLLDMLAIGIIIPVLPKLVVDFVGGDAAEGARTYGLFGTVWALMQFVFSPVQGALSDRVGRRPVILISNFGLGLGYIVMSLPTERRAPFAWRRATPVGALALLTSQSALIGLATVNFLGNLAHAALPSIGVLYMMYRYGWNERTVGLTMAGVGLAAIVVQGSVIGPVVKRFGERRALVVGLGFGAAGFTVFGLAPTGPVFWLGIPLMALWGLANASAQGLMSRCIGPDKQGQLQGANASLMGVANLIGPGLFTLK